MENSQPQRTAYRPDYNESEQRRKACGNHILHFGGAYFVHAEGEGVEPSKPCKGVPVFKTGAVTYLLALPAAERGRNDLPKPYQGVLAFQASAVANRLLASPHGGGSGG